MLYPLNNAIFVYADVPAYGDNGKRGANRSLDSRFELEQVFVHR
jgi:hypothetical protein